MTSQMTDIHRVLTSDMGVHGKIAMRAVVDDLVLLRNAAPDLLTLQGMRFRHRHMHMVFRPTEWGSWPNKSKGVATPILWQTKTWVLRDYDVADAPYAPLVAVLLEHRKTGLTTWVRTTDYPSGAEHTRWQAQNQADRDRLQILAISGEPIISTGPYHCPEHLVLGMDIAGRAIRYLGQKENQYTMLVNGIDSQFVMKHMTDIPHFKMHNESGARILIYQMRGMVSNSRVGAV
jgi:hypothetical protein